jgi:hypothetical protein
MPRELYEPLSVCRWLCARDGSSRQAQLVDSGSTSRDGRRVDENPTWGYSRIQGALQVVGHRAGRSTIARILKAHGLPPVPGRSTSWQTFLRAHWGAIAGADFFTREV